MERKGNFYDEGGEGESLVFKDVGGVKSINLKRTSFCLTENCSCC